ncbi:MAG: hypothetical protein IJU33_00210 [Bacteroidales bacterium]|nr:hypothetical protein [Bacteroidales bacterium]
MNPQVAEFIEKQKEKVIKRKEAHLRKLGLIDSEKSEKQYASANLPAWEREQKGYVNYDENGYYRVVNQALNVTDEEYAEICKYCPPEKTITDAFEKKMLEQVDILRKMMKFFVILTIISLVISFIAGLVVALD